MGGATPPLLTFCGVLAALCAAAGAAGAQVSDERVRAAVERLHEFTWAHFVGPETGILYTRANPDGTLDPLPGGALEDTSLCGGMYLAAMVDRHEVTRRAEDREPARQLARGLLLNATAGEPGYIHRGVAPNRTTRWHHPSTDQVTGWIYGTWRYWRSDIPTEAERAELRRVTRQVLSRLERDGFWIKTPEGELTKFGRLADVRPTRAERLLALLVAGHEITGDEQWLRHYAALKAERLPACAGYRELGLAGWVLVQCQIALDVLSRSAPEADRSVFVRAMRECAEAALPQVEIEALLREAEAVRESGQPLSPEAAVAMSRAVRTPMDSVTTVLLGPDEELREQVAEAVRLLPTGLPFEQFRDSRALAPMEWNYWLARGNSGMSGTREPGTERIEDDGR